MKKVLISFSGGRTSAYMAYWLLKIYYKAVWDEILGVHIGIEPETNLTIHIIVVFANTGKEREETLIFVDKCDKYFGLHVAYVEYNNNNNKSAWAAAKHTIVNFDTASRKGEPFDAMMQKYGIVNQSFPHCTRELKANTIKSYAKSLGWKRYYTAIGIRVDEKRRLDWEKAKKNKLIYALANIHPTTKNGINTWWGKQPFDLELTSYEGNCDMCWKKAFRKLHTIAKNNPELAEWWKDMELKYENYLPPHRSENKNVKLPFRFYRDNTSIDEIVEDSAMPFNEAVDESKITYSEQRNLFEWDGYLDTNDGCTESCEVF